MAASLIPELCVVCGMEEKYKADFQFKKAMDAAIKKDPRARAAAVNKFMRSFNESPAHKDFAQWGFTSTTGLRKCRVACSTRTRSTLVAINRKTHRGHSTSAAPKCMMQDSLLHGGSSFRQRMPEKVANSSTT